MTSKDDLLIMHLIMFFLWVVTVVILVALHTSDFIIILVTGTYGIIMAMITTGICWLHQNRG